MSQATYAPSAGTSPASQRALLQLLVLPVLGFLCFGIAIAAGIPSNRFGLMGLAIVTGILILSVVVVDRALPRGRRNLLLSIFTFAYVVRFVVPVFAFYLGSAGYDPETAISPIPLTPDVVTRGLFAALVGYAMLLAGFTLPFGRMASKAVPLMRREWSVETALGVALVTLLLGWAVIIAGQLGVIPERAGSGVLGTVASGAAFGIGLIALCYQRYRSRAALILLALSIPPTMFFMFFTGSKLLFLMPLMMLTIVHIVVTRELKLWWIAAGLAAMVLFYPIANAYRSFAWGGGISTLEAIAKPAATLKVIQNVTSMPKGEYLSAGLLTTAARLDGLGIVSVIVRDAGTRVPYQNGKSLTYIPLSYVPRLLWPGKPIFDNGQWVTSNFGHGPWIRSSTGATWVGELYYNFGWTGIIVGMTLLGVWFRFLQESFLRIDATIPAMLAGIVTILLLAHGLEADLISPTSGLIFRLVPILLAYMVASVFMPPPKRPPPPL